MISRVKTVGVGLSYVFPHKYAIVGGSDGLVIVIVMWMSSVYLAMQRHGAALYGAFFILVILGSGVVMASAEPVPASDSPAYTLNVDEKFTVNGQKYVVSEISTSTNEKGKILRSATFKQVGSNKTVGFDKPKVTRMLIVSGGIPTSVSYAPSPGTISLGGAEYGAYYPNNNTVKLMESGVYNREVSSMKSLNERFRGMWAVIVLSLLAAILIIGQSYLPRRG
jgi:hypothetical protein